MLLGARDSFRTGGISARDYVQDGLIAMWDGIENAGWGVHDPNATQWVDLVGGVVVTVPANARVTYQSLYFPAQGAGAAGSKKAPEYRALTAVFRRETWGSRVIWQSGNAHRTMIGNADGGTAYWYFDAYRQPVGNAYSIRNSKYGDPSGRIERITAVFATGADIYAPSQVWHNGATVAPFWSTYNASWTAPSTCRIGGAANGTNGIKGDIYNIRLYSRTLTAAEIAYNDEIDQARFKLTA